MKWLQNMLFFFFSQEGKCIFFWLDLLSAARDILVAFFWNRPEKVKYSTIIE